MALKPKRWQISPLLPQDQATRFQYFNPVVARILYNRGYTDPDAARAFLRGEMPPSDPLTIKGMIPAISRIRKAILRQEKIAVYGDFDADGVTSTALMVLALRALGAKVEPYIPHRVDEGYGLNAEALHKLAHRGFQLVITVDCGIRSLNEVEAGKQCGLDIIITDHHSVGPEVPAALAVINPKQEGCPYSEKMLAGVGIAYKLVDALFKAIALNKSRNSPPLPVKADDYLDLVAIGTVADLAPLNHAENRALVIQGLKVLRESRRPGIKALIEVAGLVPDKLDAMSIGFAIGPRLNAAGRLEHANTAYELLMTDDPQVAQQKAQELHELNVKRQDRTHEAQELVKTLVGIDGQADVPLIIADDPNFQQGIVGLVAGRLTEEFYRPAIVIHRGDHESHGSCRSIAEFNITEALDQCADLLLRHGGHAQAAGFALENDNLDIFKQRMVDIAAAGLHGKDLRPTLQIDAEVSLVNPDDLTLYNALAELEPCGHDHPAPVLCTRRLYVKDKRRVGKDQSHLRLELTDRRQDISINAIAFRMGECCDDVPNVIDVAYQLDVNEWNGSRRLQLKVLDLREPV
ncbi:MAG: single-stranded-DNA-specific exonuclease RecJ [Anaerolineae bacterium]|nr:single-stranded-DNA-specific exonuclease RecJ [Anaerolineae bacterium]